MTATDRPTLTRIPVAWAHEDGDTWWAEGHWPDEAMLLAVVVEQLVIATMDAEDITHLLLGSTKPYQELGSEWHMAAALEERLGSVARVWLKPDPANEENMLPAVEGEPDAAAWTKFTA